MFGAALDGLRKLLRRNLTERVMSSGEMLAIERVELGVVGSAVFRTKPPTPIAPLSSQK